MSEETKELEYVRLLKESQSLDDTLATATSKLKDIGVRLAEFAASLQNPETIVFDPAFFEDQTSQVPALIKQYQSARGRRMDLESRLDQFSWHRRATQRGGL